jgi:hypothetical protein
MKKPYGAIKGSHAPILDDYGVGGPGREGDSITPKIAAHLMANAATPSHQTYG